MLLVIDFSDLGFDAMQADIRIDDNADMTAGDLIGKLCEGFRKLGGLHVPPSSELQLCDVTGTRISNAARISSLQCDDWDTLYLVRRR